MSQHQHHAVNKLKKMGRGGLNAVRKSEVRKFSSCGASYPPPTGGACLAVRSPPPSEVDQAEVIVAGEDLLVGELISDSVGRLLISSSPVATTTGHAKHTIEQNVNIMAEAITTLSGRVTKLHQQMSEVQQEKLNSSWAHIKALTQVGGKNNLISSGAQSHFQPSLPVTSDVPTAYDPIIMRRTADRQADLHTLSQEVQGDSRT